MTRALAAVLVVLELGTFAAMAARVVRATPVFGPVDEQSHYAYVQFLAERGRLPLLRDPVGPEVLSLGKGVYPAKVEKPAELSGLGGKVYEAFQPPGYYALAAPVSALVPNHRTQVTALRVFGAVVLLAGVGFVAALCRLWFPGEWLPATAFASLAFLFPGVLVRSVHIGNAGLEITAVTAFYFVLSLGLTRRSSGWIYASAVLLGAALLVRLTSVSAVLVFVLALVVSFRRGMLRAPQVAAALSIPPLVLSPWLFFNLNHYGSFTANGVARGMQTYLINPRLLDFGLADAARHVYQQIFVSQQVLLPQEAALPTGSAGAWIAVAATVVFFVVPLAVAPLLRPRSSDASDVWVLGLGLPVSLGLSVILYAWQDWPMLVRYSYAMLPAALAFAYSVVTRVAGPSGALVLATGLWGIVVFLWLVAPLPS